MTVPFISVAYFLMALDELFFIDFFQVLAVFFVREQYFLAPATAPPHAMVILIAGDCGWIFSEGVSWELRKDHFIQKAQDSKDCHPSELRLLGLGALRGCGDGQGGEIGPGATGPCRDDE